MTTCYTSFKCSCDKHRITSATNATDCVAIAKALGMSYSAYLPGRTESNFIVIPGDFVAGCAGSRSMDSEYWTYTEELHKHARRDDDVDG